MDVQGVLAVANGPRGTAPHLVLQTPGMQQQYMQMRPQAMHQQLLQAQQQQPQQQYAYRPATHQQPGTPASLSLPASSPQVLQPTFGHPAFNAR